MRKTDIGYAIRTLRKARRMKRAALARQLCVPSWQIFLWEMGLRRPGAEQAAALRALEGRTPEACAKGEEDTAAQREKKRCRLRLLLEIACFAAVTVAAYVLFSTFLQWLLALPWWPLEHGGPAGWALWGIVLAGALALGYCQCGSLAVFLFAALRRARRKREQP